LKVLVIGHRNPDTDAIIATIAFSHILNSIGYEAQAFRIGNIQPETRVVLEKTRLPIPDLIIDVKPRVSDVMTKNVISINENDPIKKGIDILVEKAIRSLPVVDKNLKVLGLFSVESFAKIFLKELSIARLNLEKVLIENFLKISNSRIITSPSNGYLEGRVYVGAMSAKVIARRSDEIRGQILIVGDREDVHLEAIRAGVSTLIISGGFMPSKQVLAEAEKKGVNIIVSPHDTYTTLRFLDLSQPIRKFSEYPVIITEEAPVSELRELMIRRGTRTIIVTDELNRLKGIVTRSDLVKDYRKKIALVDHNEYSQSVAGIEEAVVVAVVDHHRISGDIKTLNPIIFRVEPLGSSNTILWRIAKEMKINIPKNLAEAMLYAILSDTLLLKSPTTTEIDRNTVKEIVDMLKIDLKDAMSFMRIAMAANEPSNPPEIINRDLKIFESNKTFFGIAQIFTTNPASYISMLNSLKQEMIKELMTRKLNFLVLMITDYIENKSYIMAVGNTAVVENALGIDLSSGYSEMAGVTSRKSQLLPNILRYLEEIS